MIARIWHGLTPPDKADDFFRYIRQTGEKAYLSAEGNRGVLILRRYKENTAEFLLISLWDSIEDIKRFAGPDIDSAYYPFPEDKDYLIELEPFVSNFDILALSGMIKEENPGYSPPTDFII